MADVERERVTALWRQAAAALEPGDYFRDPESGEYVYADDEPSAPKPCAECGRLREQLDAALRRIPRCKERTADGVRCASPQGHGGAHSHPNDAARAALGVEGEQEKP